VIQTSLQSPPGSPITPTTTTTNTNTNNTTTTLNNYNTPKSLNPWPNRIANLNQLIGMQIYHTHTPVGIYGGSIGSLLLEYWERIFKSYKREWITNKLINEAELEKTIELMREEVNELNTYMSWYSVVAQKKGYNGPTIQFDDVDDDDILHTTIF
jgi:hypothetical protein